MQLVQVSTEVDHIEAVFWVDTPAAFAVAVEMLLPEPSCPPALIALDTEFERTQTYHPQGALMQISDGRRVFLIDLTRFSDVNQVPPAFLVLLSDPNCLKILHAGREDLELIAHMWRVQVSPFFDTQWAADFVCDEPQMGLAALVSQVCQIELCKSHTRSDWLQRPLSSAQLEYAALDVVYLIHAYDALAQQLIDAGFYDRVREDFNWLYADVLTDDPMNECRWLTDAWELSPDQRSRLLRLLRWRQQFIADANMPRGWFISAQQLARACQYQFQSLDALKTWLRPVLGKHYRHIRGVGVEQLFERLHASVQNATDLTTSECVEPIAPLYHEAKGLLATLKAQAAQTTASMAWPATAVSRKKWLVSWLRLFLNSQLNQTSLERAHMTAVWRGWRGDCLHAGFLERMHQMSEQVERAVVQLQDKRGEVKAC